MDMMGGPVWEHSYVCIAVKKHCIGVFDHVL
jgi:hypothetical protein